MNAGIKAHSKTASATKTEKKVERVAPVFDPFEIAVIVKENQADVELVKLHAFYMDNKPGSITYVILAGDTSLFR